jgi:hypothetical protein
MTTEQLRQKMGADATDAEARAMAELLWERYSIDVAPLDPEAPLEQWACSNGGFRIVISDPEFFGMIPDAVARAGTAPAKKLTPSNYASIRDHLFERIRRMCIACWPKIRLRSARAVGRQRTGTQPGCRHPGFGEGTSAANPPARLRSVLRKKSPPITGPIYAESIRASRLRRSPPV